MIVSLIIVIALIAAVYLFMQQTKFGNVPNGERLELIKLSPQYKNGAFDNQSPTPSLTEGASYTSVMKEFFFTKHDRKKPSQPLPSVKTNLLQLKKEENIWVWMGHSSYFMQIDGKTILVDPVLSGSASPLSFTTKSFPGSDIYTTDDIPPIDFLFLSHDHWDHLDYNTLRKLKSKTKIIITGLGTGEHLERWGFKKSMIIEKDWNEKVTWVMGLK